ncbi:hypothetical protein AVEN_62282-1 [Araneus ventricosus]|uniref:Uncharacterized protein n=1 Tax=Araneus ventricosus TaxID=182803 RepID=A0A4Y2SWU9_ARAVE|nr:hypothetical protein AVEN_62282-1 [Araneus ventricosus]
MTTPELALPSSNFHTTPVGGRLASMYDLMCNRPTYTADLLLCFGILRPEAETLTLGLSVTKECGIENLKISVHLSFRNGPQMRHQELPKRSHCIFSAQQS